MNAMVSMTRRAPLALIALATLFSMSTEVLSAENVPWYGGFCHDKKVDFLISPDAADQACNDACKEDGMSFTGRWNNPASNGGICGCYLAVSSVVTEYASETKSLYYIEDGRKRRIDARAVGECNFKGTDTPHRVPSAVLQGIPSGPDITYCAGPGGTPNNSSEQLPRRPPKRLPAEWPKYKVDPDHRRADRDKDLSMDMPLDRGNWVFRFSGKELPKVTMADGRYIFVLTGAGELRVRRSDRSEKVMIDGKLKKINNRTYRWQGNPGYDEPSFSKNYQYVRHSQLNHGWDPVLCAGTLYMKDGSICRMNNSSGHFKPSAKCLDRVQEALTGWFEHFYGTNDAEEWKNEKFEAGPYDGPNAVDTTSCR